MQISPVFALIPVIGLAVGIGLILLLILDCHESLDPIEGDWRSHRVDDLLRHPPLQRMEPLAFPDLRHQKIRSDSSQEHRG